MILRQHGPTAATVAVRRARRRRGRLAIVGSVVLLTNLAACGGEQESAETSKGDTDFASAMTQHHAQTLQLLNMPQTLRLDADLVSWTDPTRSERFNEIDDLTAMLRAWGAEVPATGLDHASEGDHVEFDTSIEGILSDDAVSEVRRAKGAKFVDAWFQALLDHERGALALAQAYVDQGDDAAALRFAERDVERHTDLISTLERLAGRS